MSDVYIIRNQDDLYLSKQGEWVDGSESQSLFRTSHKDEALNVKVELSVRTPQLRLTIVPSALNEKGQLVFQESPSACQAIDQPPLDLFANSPTNLSELALDHDPADTTPENSTTTTTQQNAP